MRPVDLSPLTWRKSSRSTACGPNCVEVASAGQLMAIRDSKDPIPLIVVSSVSWQAFLDTLRNGQATTG
ncbi:MAG: DUF397 domain-containing protein [Actinocatenispora sp.]